MTPGAQPGPHQTLQAAVAALQNGDADAAEPLLHAVLTAEPEHADAWHLRGILQHQRGAHDEAVASIRHAIGRLPRGHPVRPGWLNNLGNVLLESGATNEAAAAYQESLDQAPDPRPPGPTSPRCCAAWGGSTKPPTPRAAPRMRRRTMPKRVTRWHAR